MSSIKCGNCGIEIQSGIKQCPECGSTKKAFFEECTDGIVFRDTTIITHKRKGFHKFMAEMITRYKISKDKNNPQEVYEERIIDKGKGTYDQIVRNPKTGIIIHEEHMRLTEHQKNK